MWNINGLGLSLRDDKVRLSETQRKHCKLLKKVGLKIVKEMMAEQTATEGDKSFTRTEIGYFNFNLAHYQIFIKPVTKTKQEVDRVLAEAS